MNNDTSTANARTDAATKAALSLFSQFGWAPLQENDGARIEALVIAALAAADAVAALPLAAALRSVMVDPKSCAYCEGTGWVFNDKSYDGHPYGRGPYIEPDDLNGGYSPCPRCNDDREVEFGSGEQVKPWRRWSDDQVDEIAAALAAAGPWPPPVDEIAAWRWRTIDRDGKPNPWSYGSHMPFLEQLGMGGSWETQSLFATPRAPLVSRLAEALRVLIDASDVTFETLMNDFAPGEAARRKLRSTADTARMALADFDAQQETTK